jgi:hypothetical protein
MIRIKIKIIFVGLTIIFSAALKAEGIPKELFCQSLATIVENQPKTNQLTVLQAFQILYLTRTIIKPEEISNENLKHQMDTSSLEGEKLVLINLPNSSYNKDEIEKLKELRKEITHLTLYKKLKKKQDQENCIKYISSYPQDYEKFIAFINEDNAKKELQENYRNSRMMSLALHQLKAFKRKGWKVQIIKNLFEMYHALEENINLSQVMLVNHSDELGRLYDAQKNILPKGAFSNLPSNIKRLSIFSCHPLEVIKYYKINELVHKFSYFYPHLNEKFSSFFGENIPVLAIKSMLKINRTSLPQNLLSGRDCSIKLEGERNIENIIISLNGSVLSASTIEPNTQRFFDCNLLNTNSNSFKIYYLGSTEKKPLGLENLKLQKNNSEIIDVPLLEYLSTDKIRHIVTIGTIGGNP